MSNTLHANLHANLRTLLTTLVTASVSTVALNTGVTGVLLLPWFPWLPVTIGITLGGGEGEGVQMPSNIFIPKNRIFFLATELNRGNKIGVRVEKMRLCILRAGSNPSSPFM